MYIDYSSIRNRVSLWPISIPFRAYGTMGFEHGQLIHYPPLVLLFSHRSNFYFFLRSFQSHRVIGY